MSEIRLFAGNYAPVNWAFCNGQIMSIAANTALFSLLGTTYGGDGQVTFALPDFRGRVAVGTGQGDGLSSYYLGQMGGSNSVTLLSSNLPPHTHVASVKAQSGNGTASTAANNYPATGAGVTSDGVQIQLGAYTASPAGNMNPGMVSVAPSGSNSPVPFANPYLGLYYIIATEGIYPSRS